jgi:hypothetical protein
MTPDLWKALIGAIVLVLTAVAAYIKMRTDIDKIRTERELSDYAERTAVKGADIAFGDDAGDSLLEDIDYGAEIERIL